MSYNFNNHAGVIVMKSGAFDATTTGVNLIDTTYNEGKFIPFSALVIGTNISGFTSAPTLQIGTSAGGYSDVVSSTSLTTLTGSNIFTFLNIVSPGNVISSSTSINVDVTVAAVSTSYMIEVFLFGAYNF